MTTSSMTYLILWNNNIINMAGLQFSILTGDGVSRTVIHVELGMHGGSPLVVTPPGQGGNKSSSNNYTYCEHGPPNECLIQVDMGNFLSYPSSQLLFCGNEWVLYLLSYLNGKGKRYASKS